MALGYFWKRGNQLICWKVAFLLITTKHWALQFGWSFKVIIWGELLIGLTHTRCIHSHCYSPIGHYFSVLFKVQSLHSVVELRSYRIKAILFNVQWGRIVKCISWFIEIIKQFWQHHQYCTLHLKRWNLSVLTCHLLGIIQEVNNWLVVVIYCWIHSVMLALRQQYHHAVWNNEIWRMKNHNNPAARWSNA